MVDSIYRLCKKKIGFFFLNKCLSIQWTIINIYIYKERDWGEKKMRKEESVYIFIDWCL